MKVKKFKFNSSAGSKRQVTFVPNIGTSKPVESSEGSKMLPKTPVRSIEVIYLPGCKMWPVQGGEQVAN